MNGVHKVLLPIGEKPMVTRVVDAAVTSGVDSHPVVVVGKNGEAVRKALGDQCEYVTQEEQLGTGHAVHCVEAALRGKADAVLVLYGDNPCVKPETIKRLAEAHAEKKPSITMFTTTVSDFNDWRKPFYDFGRLVRDARSALVKSVEKKDATVEELAIKELNPSFYCFDATWLWENLRKIKRHNAQRECYLPDLIQIAINQGDTVDMAPVDPREVIGVNTPEQLEIVRQLSKE